jgi:hypothetical protein
MHSFVSHLTVLAALAALAPAAAHTDADRPHDIIVAIDVSGSMIAAFPDEQKKPTKPRAMRLIRTRGAPQGEVRYLFDASDPQGIRWDGLQFLFDTARPEDRIALVLFSGDAAVPTRFLHPSGFLEMGKRYGKRTGRELLKELVREIQEHERIKGRKVREIQKRETALARKFLSLKSKKSRARLLVQADEIGKERKNAADAYRHYALKVLGKNRFSLFPGTSVVQALRTIVNADKANLLEPLQRDRQAWLLLFTDGVEDVMELSDPAWKEKPGPGRRPGAPRRFAHQFPTRPRVDYAYLDQLKEPEGRDRLVAGLVRPFRAEDKQVRAFTFALGEHCDEALLRAIAERTNSAARGPGDQRVGAYYNPRNNIELLERLQQVCWELRQYWVLSPEGKTTASRERFALPEPGPWFDMGLLLFRRRHDEARAPRPEEVSAAQPGLRPVKGLQVRASRSHLYYYLGPAGTDPARKGLRPNAPLELTVARTGEDGEGTCRCVVRTPKPLFAFQQPANGETYTPLDAIPFRVDFFPYEVAGKHPFQAEQFEVRAQLIPVAGPGRKGKALPAVRDVLLKPDRLAAPAAGPGSAIPFRGEVVLDPNPKKRQANLLGPYEVEVTIRALTGPLAGASRKLIRTTLRVADYPRLALPAGPVVLRNAGKDSRGVVAVEVPSLGRDPKRVVAHLEARISGKAVAAEDGPAIAAKQLALTPARLALAGGKGILNVELPARAWSRLPVGKYAGARLTVRAPWGSTGSVPVVIDKTAWRLEAPAPVVFDLSDRLQKTQAREVAVKFDAPPAVEEEAWLSTSRELTRPEEKGEVLCSDGKGGTVTLEVRGLGQAVKLGPGGPLEEGKHLALTVVRPEKMPFGVFTGEIYLVGPALRGTLRLEVRRQRFRLEPLPPVVFDLSDRTDVKGKDVPKRLDVVLDTDLKTDEDVWLSKGKDEARPERPTDQKVMFEPLTRGGTARPIVLQLGEVIAVRGRGGEGKSRLTLTLRRPEELAAGRYEAKLWLCGEAVEPREVTVNVKVDQPVVFLLGSRGRTPIDQLSQLALAGRTVHWELAFGTKLKVPLAPESYQELARRWDGHRLLRADRRDELILGVKVGPSKDRLLVELQVPASVHEGEYQAQLNYNLTGTDTPQPLDVFDAH